MLNVIVTDPPRADLAAVDALAPYGVATVHEAIGRNGYLGPAIRPNQQGARIAGVALTVVCWPGDNLMIHAAVEQARPGDIIVITTTSPSCDGAFGELLATSLAARGVRGLIMGPACATPGNCARWASPPGPRTSPRRAPSRRPPARSTSRSRSAARRSARATRSSPTTTACASSPGWTWPRRSPRPPPGSPRRTRTAGSWPTACSASTSTTSAPSWPGSSTSPTPSTPSGRARAS